MTHKDALVIMQLRDSAAPNLLWDEFPHPFTIVCSLRAHWELDMFAPKKPVRSEINCNSHLRNDIGRWVFQLNGVRARYGHFAARRESWSQRSLSRQKQKRVSNSHPIVSNIINATKDPDCVDWHQAVIGKIEHCTHWVGRSQ